MPGEFEDNSSTALARRHSYALDYCFERLLDTRAHLDRLFFDLTRLTVSIRVTVITDSVLDFCKDAFSKKRQ